MRLLVVLSFIIINQFVCSQTFDVNTRRNCNYDSITVRTLIDSLSHHFNIGFSYDANALPLDSIVHVKLQKATIKEIVYSALPASDLDVSFFMGQMVISKSNPKIEEQPNQMVRLTGRVLSSHKKEPVPLVNISILNKPIGTITNDSGRFDLLIQKQFLSDTIAFSSVGYKRSWMAMPLKDTCIEIILTEENIRLPVIEVHAVSVSQIINKVVESRNQNYLNTDVALTAFYRETVKENNRPVQISEAILEIFKPPYQQSNSFERVRFVKGRKRDDVEKVSSVGFRLQGGPYLFSRLDVARYLDFLPVPHTENIYKYALRDYSYLNGNKVFVVTFEPIVDEGDLLYKGELVINASDYAIVRVVFEMTNNTLKRSRDYLIRKDNRNYRAKPYYARYLVDYRPYKDKWMLNFVRGEIKVKVVDKKQRLKSDFVARTEMLITDLRPIDGEKIKYSDTYKPDYVLYDEVGEDDAAFWETYNIIRPDEDFNYLIEEAKK
jgi:hypothetical protein